MYIERLKKAREARKAFMNKYPGVSAGFSFRDNEFQFQARVETESDMKNLPKEFEGYEVEVRVIGETSIRETSIREFIKIPDSVQESQPFKDYLDRFLMVGEEMVDEVEVTPEIAYAVFGVVSEAFQEAQNTIIETCWDEDTGTLVDNRHSGG